MFSPKREVFSARGLSGYGTWIRVGQGWWGSDQAEAWKPRPVGGSTPANRGIRKSCGKDPGSSKFLMSA